MAGRKKSPVSTRRAATNGNDQYKSIVLTMKQFKYDQTALLEVLNSAQQTLGYLSEEVLNFVADSMKVPLSQVYGVATFYHMFTFEPKGEHNCVVCTGTACHVKGADQIVAAVSETFGVEDGGTTPDGKLSLTNARCVGSCGLAPVVVLDGVVRAKETPESIVAQLKEKLNQPEKGSVENG